MTEKATNLSTTEDGRVGCAETGSREPSFDPAREEDDYALEGWAFNVMLECSGLDDEQPSEVAIGGAILDFRDLNRILGWARNQAAQAIEAQRATTTQIGVVGDESAVAESDAPNPSPPSSPSGISREES